MLLIDKKFFGTGKLLINDFIQSFQKEFERFILNYAEQSINDQELEHIFWVGEQQVKTAVTCALRKPCNGYFMQESGVYRKPNLNATNKRNYKNGRVDYWCRYGNSTKLSILLELKHHWINYSSNEEYTLYEEAKKRHEKAVFDIKNIKKADYTIDNLFGAALTILPLFTRYKTDENKIVTLSKNKLKDLCEKILGTAKSNACGGFVIPSRLQEITTFYDSNTGKEGFQSFPAIIMLWSIYKFTKK